MTRSDSINELATALAAAQAAITPAKKDAENPHFRSKYADLASVWAACRVALPAHGLAVMQSPRLVSSGELWLVELETLLVHASGQWVSDTLAVPVHPANAQAVGSAITYARRYALAAFVGVAPDDDDANSASTSRELERPPEKPAARPKPPPATPPEIVRGVHVLGIVKRPTTGGAETFIVSADDGKTYHTIAAPEARFAKAAKDAALAIDIGYRTSAAGVREIVFLRQDVPAAEAKPKAATNG